jgi:hypothetical protein
MAISQRPLRPFMHPDEWCWRWLVTMKGRKLHRVVSGKREDEDPVGVSEGRTACGLQGTLQMPGVMERLGLPRCIACCDVVGIPYGDGAPYNQGLKEQAEGSFTPPRWGGTLRW